MPEKQDCSTKKPEKSYEIADILHGQISLHKLIMDIIKTEHFDRLHFISQLSFSSLVYPCANHTRFTHSIGVCTLAKEMVEHFQRDNSLNITDNDVLCVSIAALLHDIGHGPFSHFYEVFLEEMEVKGFKHEEMSCRIFDDIYENNSALKMDLDKNLTPQDLIFIKELINPPKPLIDEQGQWQPRGRDKSKAFLYEIVSNPCTGLDVDKIDYILRDSMLTSVGNKLSKNDWKRIVNNALVLQHPVEDRKCIAFSDKTTDSIRKVFDDRMALHKTVYQHKASLAVEMVMKEVLRAANDDLLFPGRDGRDYKMTDAFNDIDAFMGMDNTIPRMIEREARQNPKNPNLLKACQLLRQIKRRELPKCLGKLELNLSKVDERTVGHILRKKLQQLGQWKDEEDVTISLVRLHQGQGIGHRSPLEKVVIYDWNDFGVKFFDEKEESAACSLWAYIYVKFERMDELKEHVLKAIKMLKMDNKDFLLKSSQRRKLVEVNQDMDEEDEPPSDKKRARVEDVEETGEENNIGDVNSSTSTDSNSYVKLNNSNSSE